MFKIFIYWKFIIREERMRDLPSAVSFLRRPHWSGMGRPRPGASSFFLVSLVYRCPRTWAILCCSRKLISRELDWKGNRWDSAHMGGWHCSFGLLCCAIVLPLIKLYKESDVDIERVILGMSLNFFINIYTDSHS